MPSCFVFTIVNASELRRIPAARYTIIGAYVACWAASTEEGAAQPETLKSKT